MFYYRYNNDHNVNHNQFDPTSNNNRCVNILSENIHQRRISSQHLCVHQQDVGRSYPLIYRWNSRGLEIHIILQHQLQGPCWPLALRLNLDATSSWMMCQLWMSVHLTLNCFKIQVLRTRRQCSMTGYSGARRLVLAAVQMWLLEVTVIPQLENVLKTTVPNPVLVFWVKRFWLYSIPLIHSRIGYKELEVGVAREALSIYISTSVRDHKRWMCRQTSMQEYLHNFDIL